MSQRHQKRHPKSVRQNGRTYYHQGGDRYVDNSGSVLDAVLIASLLSGDNNHGLEASADYSSFNGGGGSDYSGGGSDSSYGGSDSGSYDSGGGGGGDGGGGGGGE